MKWDVFVSRKGGMNNILAPLKDTTNINDTLSPSLSSHTELSRPAKLDAISPGKREEEPKSEDRPQTPANDQQQQQVKVDERPQSPTPEQQQQRKIDDQQHITDEEAKEKNLLKGKPIIFIGGGPGIKKNNDLNIILYISIELLLKVVVKEHNVKK